MKRYKAFISFAILLISTLAFLVGQEFLPNGWSYTPESESILSLILCILWIIFFMIALWRYSIFLKTKITDWRSGLITAISVVLSICFIMGISYNCILYNFSLDVEIEQYDAHIALFVDNTFVRVEQRHPYYRYKENWLLMRELSENELNDAIVKYGDPDNYYVK